MKILSTFTVLLFLILGCTNTNETIFVGKVIEIDFNNVEDIDPDQWIKFDDFKFEHVATMDEGMNSEFPLPTLYLITDVFSDSTYGEKEMGVPIDATNIGFHIVRNLRKVNEIENNPKSKFRILESFTLTALGTLKIAKTDSSSFKITIPKDYPIKIEVLEK